MLKPKILHIIASLDPAHGGPIHGLMNYIPEFHNRGMRNEVACMDAPSEEFIVNSGFPIVHALGPSVRPWAYTPKLYSWLKQNICQYEVVIIHGLWLYHGYAVNKVIQKLKTIAFKKDIPRVYIMCHGMLDPYFQKAPERKLKAIRNEIYWRWIESKVINNADGILFTCEEEMRLAGQTFKTYKPRKVFNVGYGVKEPPLRNKSMDEAFFKECPTAVERGFILFLSRIHEKKGLDLLIQSYKENYISKQDNYNGRVPVLVIAGPGLESEYGRKMKQMTIDSGIQEHVYFTGMLSGDAKWGAFYNCEAFVLPSHQENFGIAIVEALACSKPVLISDKINIWREIKKANAGIIADDTVEGASYLLRLWKNMSESEKSAIAQNANSCFSSTFSIKPAVSSLITAVTQ